MQTNQWQRQEDESSAAFEAFVAYRDMQSRSLAKVAELLGKELSHIAGWSGRHRWVKRCVAWDNELDRRVQDDRVEQIKEMKRRQLETALEMQNVASAALRKLQAQIDDPDKRARITPDNIARLIDIGTRLERLNRDEPESICQVQSNDFSHLSASEMLQLRGLLDKSGV